AGDAETGCIQRIPLDEVGRRFCYKSVHSGKQASAIDQRSARRGKLHQSARAVQYSLHIAPIHTGGGVYRVDTFIRHNGFAISGNLPLVGVPCPQSGGEIVAGKVARIVIVIQPTEIIMADSPLTTEMGFLLKPGAVREPPV